MRAGFSLIELVVVLVIIGVISISVAARMSSTVERTRAFYDELLSQVQYARKVAVAQRRAVFVRIDAAQSRLCYSAAGACDAASSDGVASPTGQVPFRVAVPAGVAPSPVSFQFDALGRTRDAASALTTTPITITVAGDGNYQFLVEHETGYAR